MYLLPNMALIPDPYFLWQRLQLQLQHTSQEQQLYQQQLEALQGQLSGGSQRGGEGCGLQVSKAVAAADRTALEAARRKLEGREATVSALKAKVVELVADAQRQLQAKLRTEGSLQRSPRSWSSDNARATGSSRDLERRLQAAEAALRRRQEHAALTARLAELSEQLQRTRMYMFGGGVSRLTRRAGLLRLHPGTAPTGVEQGLCQ